MIGRDPDDCFARPALGRSPVVVVADDDEIYRRTVAAELSQAGFQAVTCDGGLMALLHFALGERADALVTDIQMPGSLDGLFLAVEARDQRPDLPVVYMSAQPLAAERMVAGARFVAKPYRLGAVASAVHDVLCIKHGGPWAHAH